MYTCTQAVSREGSPMHSTVSPWTRVDGEKLLSSSCRVALCRGSSSITCVGESRREEGSSHSPDYPANIYSGSSHFAAQALSWLKAVGTSRASRTAYAGRYWAVSQEAMRCSSEKNPAQIQTSAYTAFVNKAPWHYRIWKKTLKLWWFYFICNQFSSAHIVRPMCVPS